MTIGALGRRGWLRLGGIKQGQRLGRAANCRFTDVIGVGKAGHLAGYAAQAKARVRAVIGGFQPSVIKAKALARARSEEHTSELQSPMRTSSAVFCLNNKKN